MKKQKSVSPSAIRKIESFWRWYSKNVAHIENALLYHENEVEVFSGLNKKLDQVSKRMGYVLRAPKKEKTQHFTLIFTVEGRKSMIGLATAFEQRAPKIINWVFQALIPPYKDIEEIKVGNDRPFKFQDFELIISEMYFDLLDYDITKKHINIQVYLKNYQFHYDNDFLEKAVNIVLEELLGEIAYNKYLAKVQLAQIPKNQDDLTPLYELPQYIGLISKANQRLKI